ncbi:MAG: hypothetical protein K2L75_07315, partial [Muribaculaceae bacterium]|nr:hypothetical protein [Muribaculaceae bacterium]
CRHRHHRRPRHSEGAPLTRRTSFPSHTRRPLPHFPPAASALPLPRGWKGKEVKRSWKTLIKDA